MIAITLNAPNKKNIEPPIASLIGEQAAPTMQFEIHITKVEIDWACDLKKGLESKLKKSY